MNNLTTPVNATQPRIYSKYMIYSINIELDVKATIRLRLFTEDEKNDEVISFDVTGTDYENWGTDDSYIHTIIQNKLIELYSSAI